MENASKALIIAGEVLIGILFISLIVLINTIFGSFSANLNSKMSEAQITEFNNNFYAYNTKINISATQIATIINFAKQQNDYHELKRNETSSLYYIDVIIDGNSFFNHLNEDEGFINLDSDYDNYNNYIAKVNKFLNANNKKMYSCNCEKAEKSLIDKKITITTKDTDI